MRNDFRVAGAASPRGTSAPRQKLDQWGTNLHLQGLKAGRRKESEKLRGQKFGAAGKARTVTDEERRAVEERLRVEGRL